MRQRLTDRVVNQKAPESGMLELHDKLLPAFGIRIGQRKRTYFVMGRLPDPNNPEKQKQVRRVVGTPNELTLAQAREKARGMLANFANDVDPQEAEKAARREAARARRNTFAAVAAGYMKEHGCHLRSAGELRRKLNADILPTAFADLAVADIRRADVKELIRTKAETAPIAANRLLALVRAILFFAVDEELVESNVAVRIKAQPEIARERTLTEAEIKSFWNGLEDTAMAPEIKRVLKLLLVTGQRRSEVAGMRWAEVDLDKATWTLPASKTKGRRTHIIPLSPLALELLGEPSGEYVFANGGGKPFRPTSISYSMLHARDALGLADDRATVHDLRRTMASGLGALGIDRHVISKVLGHAEQGVTARHYDMHAYAREKRLAMEAWSAKLREIVSGEPMPSSVVRLEGAKK